MLQTVLKVHKDVLTWNFVKYLSLYNISNTREHLCLQEVKGKTGSSGEYSGFHFFFSYIFYQLVPFWIAAITEAQGSAYILYISSKFACFILLLICRKYENTVGTVKKIHPTLKIINVAGWIFIQIFHLHIYNFFCQVFLFFVGNFLKIIASLKRNFFSSFSFQIFYD